jgi:hypothetical protein
MHNANDRTVPRVGERTGPSTGPKKARRIGVSRIPATNRQSQIFLHNQLNEPFPFTASSFF